MKFQCTNCGNCCRRTGLLLFRGEEEAIATQTAAAKAGVDITPQMMGKVKDQQVAVGTYFIHVIDACPMLEQTTGHCRIQERKPHQCSSYPFNQAYLTSPKSRLAIHKECEGLDEGNGHDYSYAEQLQIAFGQKTTASFPVLEAHQESSPRTVGYHQAVGDE